MKKCKCGSVNFTIVESIVHKATLLENGILEAFSIQENSIDNIECRGCGEAFAIEEFKDISFT